MIGVESKLELVAVQQPWTTQRKPQPQHCSRPFCGAQAELPIQVLVVVVGQPHHPHLVEQLLLCRHLHRKVVLAVEVGDQTSIYGTIYFRIKLRNALETFVKFMFLREQSGELFSLYQHYSIHLIYSLIRMSLFYTTPVRYLSIRR